MGAALMLGRVTAAWFRLGRVTAALMFIRARTWPVLSSIVPVANCRALAAMVIGPAVLVVV